jgi:hypothetical protein
MMALSNGTPQEVPPTVALLRMIDGFFISQSLHVAAQLGIADQLANGPKDVSAIDELL